MSAVTRSIAVRLAVPLLAAMFVVGCTGDVDPLEEAIVVRDLDLTGLSIVRPRNTQTPLRINAGERLQFSLEGTDSGGDKFELESEGLNWRVSDSRIATIDGNGRLTAREDGEVQVRLSIGDVTAREFDVEVRTRPVSSVERVVGPDPIDPCVVLEYHAIGGFGQVGERVDERLLMSATWRVEGAGTEIVPQEDGSVRLSASDPGTIRLFASFNEAENDLGIVVGSAPTSLTVGPSTLTGAVGSTVELSAVAAFAGEEGGASRQETVTRSVEWRVVSGAEFVSISDDPETRGRLTVDRNGPDGTRGTATLQAVCGAVESMPRSFIALASSSGGSSTGNGLAFEGASGARSGGIGGNLTIDTSLAGNNPFQLQVSTGSEYDAGEDVTTEAIWEVLGDEEFPIGVIDDDGLDRGRLTLSGTGRLQVRVTFGGSSSTLTITVI